MHRQDKRLASPDVADEPKCNEQEKPSRSVSPGPTSKWTSRLLELELMNQWSTTTYKSFCGSMEAEYHTWQVTIPRDGLECSFLLHSLLAMAALESHVLNQPPHSNYLNAALELHGTSLQSFRAVLAENTPNRPQPILAFSLITMVLSLAIPQFTKYSNEPQSVLYNLVSHYNMMQGVGALAIQNWTALREAPICRNLKVFDEMQMKPLDPDLQTAMDRLNTLNAQRHNVSLGQDSCGKIADNHTSCCVSESDPPPGGTLLKMSAA